MPNNKKAYNTCIRKADRLLSSVKRDIEKNGVRENQGQDKARQLDSFISTQAVTYQEKCDIREYFQAELEKLFY